jgi:hypothetical protein
VRGADCDTGHYFVVAKVRERLAVRKRAKQKFDMGRFDLKKPKAVEDKAQYHVKISNGFAALENLNDDVDINRAWETIKREYQNFSQRESRLLRIVEA